MANYKEEAIRLAAEKLKRDRSNISEIPQSKTLGVLSNVLTDLKGFGNKASVPSFVPLIGGQGIGDLFVGDADKELQNLSYGNSPFDMPYSGTGGYIPRVKPNRQKSLGDLVFFGESLTGAGPLASASAKSAAKSLAPKADEMLEDSMRKYGLLMQMAPSGKRSFADLEFDPRYGAASGSPTKSGINKVKNLNYTTEQVGNLSSGMDDTVSIIDLANAGTPFITPMADRSEAAQMITNFNGVELSRPVWLQGGQDYGFQGKGAVYANDKPVAENIFNFAKYLRDKYGADPVLMPHTMTPSGSDFATFSSELAMSYAYEVLDKAGKKKLDDLIKNKGFDVLKTRKKADGTVESYTKNYKISDWHGIDDPRSIEQMRNAPADLRKSIVSKLGVSQNKRNMDTAFGDTLLSPGQIRAGVSDLDQLTARDGSFRNVGLLDLSGELTPSGDMSFSYPTNLPGEMVGRLIENDLTVYDIPNLMVAGTKESGPVPFPRQASGLVDPNNLNPTDQRSLNLNLVGGQFNEDTLRWLESQGLLGMYR